jgi:hypothetical protein
MLERSERPFPHPTIDHHPTNFINLRHPPLGGNEAGKATAVPAREYGRYPTRNHTRRDRARQCAASRLQAT